MKAVKSFVYSVTTGVFGVSALERPLAFEWRFTADHRTLLH